MTDLILLIGGVLLSSGFFSGSEAALLSLTDAEVESLKHQNRFGSGMLDRVKKRVDRSVIAIVIMNNIVNIVGSILVGQVVQAQYGNAMLAVATTALTFGVIVFSEIIPKSLGIHYAPQLAPIVALPVWLLTSVFYPLIIILEKLTKLLKRGERHVGTEDQIRSLVTIGRRAGHIESDEGQLIHRAFILNDKQASDVMTELKDLIGIQSDMTVTEAWQKIENLPHTRYPIFGSSVHEVVGTALRHDILEALYDGKSDLPVTDIQRDALVVPADTQSDQLIKLFRDENKHMGVVQDDGKTIGLVTLEDVIEELFGEIEDETDVEV